MAAKAAMAVASDPARYGAVATLTDGSFPLLTAWGQFRRPRRLQEFHEASGNTVSFHHVFDFTVTRVSKNEAAWKDGAKAGAHVDAALLRRQDGQGRSLRRRRRSLSSFFDHLGLVGEVPSRKEDSPASCRWSFHAICGGLEIRL
jgi:hypothetical protein